MPTELERICPFLSRDPIRYLDMTQPLARGTGTILDADEHGAAVRTILTDGSSQYSLCADTADRARQLVALLPEDAEFVSWHEALSFPFLQARFGYPIANPCWQVGYPGPEPLPIPAHSYAIRTLDESFFAPVRAQYDLIGDDSLRLTLRRGELLGAFDGDTLAGFIGWHDDGTIGLPEVCPAYRRRGLATLLESYITNADLSRGYIPYGQVFADNSASLALQAALGYQRAKGPMYWPEF